MFIEKPDTKTKPKDGNGVNAKGSFTDNFNQFYRLRTTDKLELTSLLTLNEFDF